MKQSPIVEGSLGFRVHSGWAVSIVLGEPVAAPTIVDRRRIEIANSKIVGSKQPYHAAQALSLREAERLIAACLEASVRLAKEAVQAVINDAMRNGIRVVTSGVLTGSAKPLPALEKILSSHPLLHTAEGELFRNAIRTVCGNCGLSVVSVKEKEVLVQSSSLLGISEHVIQQRLVRMGKDIGPPWRQDEKHATLVAWLALAAQGDRVGGRKISVPTKRHETPFSSWGRKRGAKAC